MTKHEAVVIMAYTDTTMLAGVDLGIFWEYCSKLLGHPIYTHEYLEYADKIKELAKPDFIEICGNLEDTEQVATKDNINHPFHYTNREHECIDEMVAVFGIQAVIDFCKCNAWKYRYRADSKGSHDDDMKKADWYISKMMELQER